VVGNPRQAVRIDRRLQDGAHAGAKSRPHAGAATPPALARLVLLMAVLLHIRVVGSTRALSMRPVGDQKTSGKVKPRPITLLRGI